MGKSKSRIRAKVSLFAIAGDAGYAQKRQASEHNGRILIRQRLITLFRSAKVARIFQIMWRALIGNVILQRKRNA